MIKRTCFTQREAPTSPRLFHRTKDETPLEKLYTQGVTSILANQNFLSLAPDTTLLAIQIYRSHLQLDKDFTSSQCKAAYLASILLAAKISEIAPPLMDELEEAECYKVDMFAIVKAEEKILKACDFLLPINCNMLTALNELIPDNELTEEVHNRCIQLLFQTLHDPIFLPAPSEAIAHAALVFGDPEHPIKKSLTKAADCLVRRIKHLKRPENDRSLKQKNS